MCVACYTVHFFSFYKRGLEMGLTVILCLLPYHLLISLVWLVGALSTKAFIASVLSFISYESASLLTHAFENQDDHDVSSVQPNTISS